MMRCTAFRLFFGALSAKASLDHSIAEVWVQVDEMLDALRHDLIDDRDAIVLTVVGGAARHFEYPANQGFWPSSSSREPVDIGSTELKGRIPSFPKVGVDRCQRVLIGREGRRRRRRARAPDTREKKGFEVCALTLHRAA